MMTGVSSCSLCRKSTTGPLILLTFSCRWFSLLRKTPTITKSSKNCWRVCDPGLNLKSKVQQGNHEGEWPVCVQVGCICFFDDPYNYIVIKTAKFQGECHVLQIIMLHCSCKHGICLWMYYIMRGYYWLPPIAVVLWALKYLQTA